MIVSSLLPGENFQASRWEEEYGWSPAVSLNREGGAGISGRPMKLEFREQNTGERRAAQRENSGVLQSLPFESSAEN